MALTDNLIAYYKLDWNSNDSVGWNNGTDTSVPYVAGKIGNGWSFNGTNSKTLVSSNLWITNWPCSISLWCKLNAEITTGTYQLATKQDLTTQVGYGLQYEYNGGTRRLALLRNRANIPTNAVYYTASLWTSNYFHFCITYDGTNVEGYVNGSSIGTIASSGNGAATGYTNVLNIWYVSYWGVDQQYANAIIDEVWIYSRALSWSEVSQLYNGWAWLTYPFTTQASNPAFLLNFL